MISSFVTFVVIPLFTGMVHIRKHCKTTEHTLFAKASIKTINSFKY